MKAMKDFYKMIEDKIKQNIKTEGENILSFDFIDEKTASDKEKELNKKIEDLYFKFFIDTTLVKIIENQIMKINSVEDINKNFKVIINFQYFGETFNIYNDNDRKVISSVNISVTEPSIGNSININWNEITKEDMYLIYKVLPKWIILHNHLSFDAWHLNELYDDIIHDDGMDDIYIEKYLNLSFTSSLSKLINMYYAEKQREEDIINHQSNKHIKYYNN